MLLLCTHARLLRQQRSLRAQAAGAGGTLGACNACAWRGWGSGVVRAVAHRWCLAWLQGRAGSRSTSIN